ncbi:MAG: hypothetical protein GW779_01435 [Candidatus Altiarchaeum hamiconexum]|uniref:Uncharacterized protein n=1 Tax=Candidatus Altarchaeum hamiconexum TaxID=1803513 RepID=A0A8J8CEE0_9ARCH|nr:hypothetical protein [Candidatus Altarchaeum hamiconexum]OIQ04796.1 MAG: hypothetical protein AUK59_06295 [Candidatus Altarchaeum sp. CG2_30_32_3053]PIN67930.1 MAG: hypothetical protein COV98_01035 [Candidatus Altarchaeum sp. CG12_big_fil_rev_8_21_14_0_65_33_22]PIV27763.1 MAG: hypothetical protein COS36_04685 [Candidatus Altarchaeum sp. CG03_land_8_20_14_0_80_32_618]PIX48307.1 MAG: hypothetical protein COZ53_04500 [Candidatus Altarchaeum sp. CG_4_8_14_3_um_filter_33_2054]PIZ30877.1 MAG: hyp
MSGENLIYLIAAVIFGLAIGVGVLYVLYLKEILNRRELKRGIINGTVFGIFGIIIVYVFFNFCETSAIVVAVMCLILLVFIRQIVKKKIN